MKGKVERDLTEGNVAKQLLMFALPFLLSNLIQTFYNVADMFIVGQFVGTNGISGVNIGGQVTFLMTTLVIGLSTGGTVVIAQYLGNHDRKAVKECIGTLLIALFVSAITITTVMLFLSDAILHLIRTPEESYADARSYLDITIFGTVFIFGYNALSAIMRGMGDSKRPMMFVAISCVTNIALDYLLVGVFSMGAKGAAIATVFSQAMSMILCISFLMRHDFIFDFKLASFKFYPERFAMLMKIGIPMSIQALANNFSFLFLTTIANSFGVTASAALGIVGKYNGFAILPGIAIGNSVSAVAAQNIGAGRYDRARKALHTGLALTVAFSIPIFLFTWGFSEQIIRLFDTDPETIRAGAAYLTWFKFDYLAAPLFFAFNGIITGSGHTGVSSSTGILSALGFRIPVGYLFAIMLSKGMQGLGLAGPLASAAALAIVLFYYLSGKWKRNAVIREDKGE